MIINTMINFTAGNKAAPLSGGRSQVFPADAVTMNNGAFWVKIYLISPSPNLAAKFKIFEKEKIFFVPTPNLAEEFLGNKYGPTGD